ncbi:hypothetical protein RB195_013095 [Necator americanus]|uniref:Uncharacterized protein n=1 Tax=Necator americanus TaxID=51031 RepID=A0ABR1DTZ9_NECAM
MGVGRFTRKREFWEIRRTYSNNCKKTSREGFSLSSQSLKKIKAISDLYPQAPYHLTERIQTGLGCLPRKSKPAEILVWA